MKNSVPLPHDGSAFWKFLCWLISYVFRPYLCTLTVEGRENVPETGGVVVASNHTMGPDYVILGYSSPRQIFYMAKSESFDINPWLSKFLHAVGTFPVARFSQDAEALKEAITLVKSGKVLGMFPEGTRSRTGSLNYGRSGTVRIAAEANAPIVPATVLNSRKLLYRFKHPFAPRDHMTVRFGEPMPVDPAVLDDPDALRETTERMMLAIAKLLPAEHRGVYAEMVETEQT